jgi:hypothetical protein
MEKVIFKTTLKQLRKEKACISDYNKLVCSLSGKTYDEKKETYIRYKHDAPINLLTILESNDVQDCLWSLRAVNHPEIEKIARHIACDCADIVANDELKDIIAVSRKFADGNATNNELSAARSAAWSAAESAQSKIIKSYLTY